MLTDSKYPCGYTAEKASTMRPGKRSHTIPKTVRTMGNLTDYDKKDKHNLSFFSSVTENYPDCAHHAKYRKEQ